MTTINEYIFKFQKMNKTMSYMATVPFIKDMENYLLTALKAMPNDVENICTLASVRLELQEDNSVELLNNFYNQYSEELNPQNKSRILTNLGFYYQEDSEPEKEQEVLKQAIDYNSPYSQTYYALGINYYEQWKYRKYKLENKKNADQLLSQSEKYFKMAINISDEYQYSYCYGTALFMNKKIKQAKKIFDLLLQKYPNRQRLKLNIATCETALGNKKEALKILPHLKCDGDDNYNSFYNDDVDEWDLADLYYNLGEYSMHSDIYKKNMNNWAVGADTPDYCYSLFIQNKIKELDTFVANFISDEKNTIEDYKNETITDTYTLEEQQEDIQYSQQRILKMYKLIKKIKHQNYKPVVPLILEPIYSCYLIDCIRHKKFE